MKNKKKVIAAILFCASFLGILYSVSDDRVYFTTTTGIELTEQQYKNLTKAWTEEELNALPKACIEENKNDPNLRSIASDEVTVKSTTYYDENGEPLKTIHEDMSE